MFYTLLACCVEATRLIYSTDWQSEEKNTHTEGAKKMEFTLHAVNQP